MHNPKVKGSNPFPATNFYLRNTHRGVSISCRRSMGGRPMPSSLSVHDHLHVLPH